MGGTCGTHGGGKSFFTVFWLGVPEGRSLWENIGVYEMITLRYTLG